MYPTPFELHFSAWHLERFPDEYLKTLKGTDKDLASHISVLRHTGRTLYGKAIDDVFGPVSREAYLNSLWHDIAGARKDVVHNPMYMILNVCRVLAYANDDLVLSKSEGGWWDRRNIPDKFRDLICAALDEYEDGVKTPLDERLAREFADYMLAEMKKAR